MQCFISQHHNIRGLMVVQCVVLWCYALLRRYLELCRPLYPMGRVLYNCKHVYKELRIPLSQLDANTPQVSSLRPLSSSTPLSSFACVDLYQGNPKDISPHNRVDARFLYTRQPPSCAGHIKGHQRKKRSKHLREV